MHGEIASECYNLKGGEFVEKNIVCVCVWDTNKGHGESTEAGECSCSMVHGGTLTSKQVQGVLDFSKPL